MTTSAEGERHVSGSSHIFYIPLTALIVGNLQASQLSGSRLASQGEEERRINSFVEFLVHIESRHGVWNALKLRRNHLANSCTYKAILID